MGAASSEELQLLTKFRHNVVDLKLEGFYNTDLGLLQWLRARDLNLDKAEEMLRKSMKWRVENKMDSILTWKPPAMFQILCPVDYCGFDIENSPICFIPFGTWDPRRMVNLGYRDDYIRYSDQIIEKLRDKAKTKFSVTGVPVSQYTIIGDMRGLSVQTLACMGAINMFMDSLRSVEANYPETIKKLIIVNASYLFAAFFALVKPLLSQRTFGKIEIYNSNMEKWMKVLRDLIPEEQIPLKLKKIRKMSDSAATFGSNGQISVVVGAGDKLVIDFDVKVPQSVLSWWFKTEKYGIGFSLVNNKEEEVPYRDVKSHKEPHEGVIVCETVGLYQFIFDNSDSHLREKVLKYRIELNEAQ